MFFGGKRSCPESHALETRAVCIADVDLIPDSAVIHVARGWYVYSEKVLSVSLPFHIECRMDIEASVLIASACLKMNSRPLCAFFSMAAGFIFGSAGLLGESGYKPKGACRMIGQGRIQFHVVWPMHAPSFFVLIELHRAWLIERHPSVGDAWSVEVFGVRFILSSRVFDAESWGYCHTDNWKGFFYDFHFAIILLFYRIPYD